MGRLCSTNQMYSIGTNMAACSSFCCLFMSAITNYWLCTMERTPLENGTWIYLTVYSGLWKRCTQDPRSAQASYLNCTYINYFTHVDRDGLGPTDSILLSLRRATPFPMIGLILLLSAQIICFLSHCSPHRQTLTITFGVMYVAGGLLTLVGIIIYIGAITEEAGNKIKSKEDFPFKYNYGPSLLMAITSFVSSQVTGVISVNLYISRKQSVAVYRRKEEMDSYRVPIRTDTDDCTVSGSSPPVDHRNCSSLGRGGGGGGGGVGGNGGEDFTRYFLVNPADEVGSWKLCGSAANSPSRSDTYCTDTASKEASSYTILIGELPKSVLLPGNNDYVKSCSDRQDQLHWTDPNKSQPVLNRDWSASSTNPRRDRLQWSDSMNVSHPVLTRDWSVTSANHRGDLTRQLSERSNELKPNLSRQWSRCSTEELDLSRRRITPV